MLPEAMLSTKFLKLEIRKVQLEAKDIPLLAGIFGMDKYACVFLQWQFENKQNKYYAELQRKPLHIVKLVH